MDPYLKQRLREWARRNGFTSLDGAVADIAWRRANPGKKRPASGPGARGKGVVCEIPLPPPGPLWESVRAYVGLDETASDDEVIALGLGLMELDRDGFPAA